MFPNLGPLIRMSSKACTDDHSTTSFSQLKVVRFFTVFLIFEILET